MVMCQRGLISCTKCTSPIGGGGGDADGEAVRM